MTFNPGFKISVPGRPPAKSNSYRIVRVGSFSKLVATAEVKHYEATLAEICRKQLEKMEVDTPLYPKLTSVEMVVIWHRADRRRKDLDNISKSIKDGITMGGVWADDTQVSTLVLRSTYDALEVGEEWVDIYLRSIPNPLGMIKSLSRSKKKSNISCISDVDVALSALDQVL